MHQARQKFHAGPALVLALMLCSFAVPASALLFTNETLFNTANPGLPRLTFEGIAPPGVGQDVSGDFPGVTIADSGAGHTPIVLSATFTNAVFPGAPSDFLSTNHFGDFLSLTFDVPQFAVGFTVAIGFTGGVIPSGQIAVTARNGAASLGTDTLTINGLTTFDSFVGYSGLGPITEIDIAPVTDHGFVNIDNLAFAGPTLPEPSTIALIALALAALGRLRARTARKQQGQALERRTARAS